MNVPASCYESKAGGTDVTTRPTCGVGGRPFSPHASCGAKTRGARGVRRCLELCAVLPLGRPRSVKRQQSRRSRMGWPSTPDRRARATQRLAARRSTETAGNRQTTLSGRRLSRLCVLWPGCPPPSRRACSSSLSSGRRSRLSPRPVTERTHYCPRCGLAGDSRRDLYAEPYSNRGLERGRICV